MAAWLAALLAATLAAAEQPNVLIFEAEDVSGPKDAWGRNIRPVDKWNLWSTDVDAEKKWSGGVVLQSPPVPQDRARPEDGAPVLHTVITGIPPGQWRVRIRYARELAVSMDGKKWIRLSKTRGWLGRFDIRDGRLEFWVDDRFAHPTNRGPCYYDCVILYRVVERTYSRKVRGWARRRVQERLDRGLVALRVAPNRVYLSWRLLRTDPRSIAFHVYRRVGGGRLERLTARPIRATTDFVDANAPPGVSLAYFVRPVIGGRLGMPSKSVHVPAGAEAKPYISIKLQGSYQVQKVGIADLNGDGRYDFVAKQPNFNIDPAPSYWKPSPGTYKLEAYLSDGTFLWRRDLGWAIERGIWYSPYVVYDLDGDGRAEVAVKTGEGDPRGPDGRVTSGPEWLSIWDGMTGREITRVPWPSREGFENYNLMSRNQLGIAYLDGKTPCLIVERGTYSTIKVVAYQYRRGRLQELWRWDSRDEVLPFSGQGAHFMHAADVDGDGRDEIIIGSCVIDDDGRGLWTTGKGHPDHCYVGDIDPSRPGLEIYYGMETPQSREGVCLVDARTGKVIWGISERTYHVHASGLVSDFIADYPGMECYSGEKEMPRGRPHRWLHTCRGELVVDETKWDVGLSPRAAYWDADPQRELIVRGRIMKYPRQVIFERIEGNQVAWADILGDWREEIITSVPGELRIYVTTIPAADRRVCLMQDPIYRLDVAHLSMGYPQVPMLSRCPPPRR